MPDRTEKTARGKNGGRRPGSGRKPISIGLRDKARIEALRLLPEALKAIEADLKAGRTDSYFKLIEHGYGRPPQAVDVSLGGGDGLPLAVAVRLVKA